jgi:ribonuclease P protein component
LRDGAFFIAKKHGTNTQGYTYGKKEKLKSRKLLEQVFSQGKSFTVFPLKVIYVLPAENQDFPVKLGVGASGRYFKKAVHRNRIKRLLREAYRCHKQPLHTHLHNSGQQVAVFLLYVDKVLPAQQLLQQKMPLVIQKLTRELHETAAAHT